ncbi:MAG TPA: PAS domain S-box protein, partial [Chitinophagales bacterium]|nr:PAS domain S-box protein [Chitinophagales bacterium]
KEFLENYILPNNIFSMMDSCIISEDIVWGALCFDQINEKRKWTVEEQLFVNSLAGFIAFAYESSQKKEAQLALNHSEELYQYIVENAGEAIFIINPSDSIIESNKLTEELTGYLRTEIESISLNQVFNPLDNGEELVTSIRKEGAFGGTVKFVRKNGDKGIADIHANIFPDGNIQVIARDITEQHKQALALKESETRLELALKGADLGTWDFIIREDKMIHNKRWAEMLGYNFEFTVVNEQFWEKFVHPEDIETANSAFQKHLKGEIPYYEATIRMLASNGEWRWIMDKGRVVEWDENGEPVRASGIHQDINELKIYERELQQQRLFLQQILNIIPYPIYVRNLNNEFVLINKAFAEMLGYSKNEILQYQFLKKIELDDSLRYLLETDNDIFLSKLPIHYSEIKYKSNKTGSTHWLQTIKVPLKDSEGNLTELLSVSTDITELKKKEKELASLNEELEGKVNKRTAMLEAANKELETFNYSVSHDLRTPLRTIDIFAYFLEKNYKEVLDEEGGANILQIRQSIMKMTSLIDNLLIYSKMGRMDIHNTTFNLEDLLRESVVEVSKQMGIEKVEFKYEDLPDINTDYNLLKQAVVNLISNAVKFSATKKLPIIEFSGKVQGRNITFSIKDNGVGFSMEFKDKLFKAFKRLHSEEHFEGSGVGLAIVEKVVKRLNGRIWAESEENTGTTFFISLPR